MSVESVSDALSDPGAIESGVPLGLVLEPILFLMYINVCNLCNGRFSGRLVAFEDYTTSIYRVVI